MQVDLCKDKIYINKVVAEKRELFFVQDDIIVPDSKPDILSSINVSGNVCVYKKEVEHDKVKIEGNINTYVMYLPESADDNLRALNCNMDFSKSIPVPSVKEGMVLITKCEIKDIECKVINGRKISLKAGVEVLIKVFSNEDVEFITSCENIEDIQTLNQDITINSLIGNSKTSIYAKETLNIEATDELAEILQVEINLCNKDVKLSYNKVLTKADAEIKILYLTEDNRIGRAEGKVPIIGFIDIQNISEDNQVDINYEIKNIIIKPNQVEDHSIYVELEVEPSCMAYVNKNISLIEDLYSPTKNLEFSQKRISTTSNIVQSTNEFTLKENIQVQGIENGNIVNVKLTPIINNISVKDSKLTYVGEIKLDFILSNENTLTSRTAKIPFEVIEDNPHNTENINIETEIIIEDLEYEVKTQGEVEVKIKAKIFTKSSKNINMNIIDNIEIIDEKMQSDEDYDSLILYIVEPGDTLWKIAKKFDSTVDDLACVNEIEDVKNIQVGQKIYIPKFNFMIRKNKESEPEGTYM